MNKMEQVAKLFGKDLNEEFTVRIKYKGKLRCKICNSGFYYHEPLVGDWLPASGETLIDLLKGEAVVVDG